MICDRACSLQRKIKDQIDILAALYGSRLAIQVYIDEIRTAASDDASFKDKIRRELQPSKFNQPFADLPRFVCDVTVAVAYSLESQTTADGVTRGGLSLSGSKSSIVGFYNPVPPSLAVEHENPVLCIVY